MNTPIIIAEAGVNHNGSIDTAFKMIDAAVEANVDYIKFQTFKTDSLVTVNCSAAEYQKENCNASSQADMLRKLELTGSEFIDLSRYCKFKGIGFLSTPFDEESIRLIASLHPDFMKIPSGEITNLPYLRQIAQTGIPVIISTGMSTLNEVEDALKPFRLAGYNDDDIILLHCTTQYPTSFSDVNLQAMITLKEAFGLKTGYSDHTKGIEIPVAAAALGAVVIEKHFTLSRNMEGPDHKASLEPEELKQMVESVRNVALALGSTDKIVTSSERVNLKVARRSIVASGSIKKGEPFSESNLTCKRPGNGLSPMLWDKIIGKRASKDYGADELISTNEIS